ncbi:MAG: pyrophosphate--fructose-6-phosphate 1-phosphotransferase, partial [Puniceicoccales bacterium]|nr:pyrophosphate--fructose-6-phosphate 1-phosphotransferase [Puniceicoccales bacterium]
GQTTIIDETARQRATELLKFGGTPIGNSRVKLSNRDDCRKRGWIKDNETPFEVAASRIMADQITVLHTIGGDDTNSAAAELSEYLKNKGYGLHVIGLPKTIDNDIVPIHQSLGALSAAEQGALYFENIVSEYGASGRMLIIHEVMGRHCGWLTFATAKKYLERLKNRTFIPSLGLIREQRALHGVFVPELPIPLENEADRLRKTMETVGCVHLFVSEGAFINEIVQEMETRGPVSRDPFGHVKLDTVNTGQWVGDRLAPLLGAEKMLVQKSGYFARSAAANGEDLRLIQSCVDFAVECAFRGQSGVIGHDEEHRNQLRCIEFSRIRGGKLFDVKHPEFLALLKEIGQTY